jgi:lysophospholipase L1-like esterase
LGGSGVISGAGFAYLLMTTMRPAFLRILQTASVWLLALVAVAASADTPRLPHLFLIGDSTVNNGTRGQMGWGTALIPLFDAGKVTVENRARGGRSSRTFLTEGLWDKVAADLKPGDWVLMQFGHNDGGSLTDSKARASLKGSGEDTQEAPGADGKPETVHTYGWYLRKFIKASQAKGATAIVLSPIPRNIWTKDGKVARASGDYGKWAAEAAKATGATYIDLNEIIAGRYEVEGKEKVALVYFGQTDHTHTTPEGAKFNADSVVRGIRALPDCPLAGFLLPQSGAAPAERREIALR